MGIHDKITYKRFPLQGPFVGSRVKVVFHFDLSQAIFGTVVREDAEDPWQMIIRLDDDRYVLATECQYSYLN